VARGDEFQQEVTALAEPHPHRRKSLNDPSRRRRIAAGVYCTVELKIARQTPSLMVPAKALIFNRDGLQVAVVKDGKSEIRKVRVTGDLGTQVEVDAGVKPGDRVILIPPVNLIEGSKVHAAGCAMKRKSPYTASAACVAVRVFRVTLERRAVGIACE
jgi:hypothetical protein